MTHAAELNVLIGFGFTYAVLAVTPGANFLLVTQISLSAPRHHALVSAAGIAIGASTVALFAFSGALALTGWHRVMWGLNLGFALLLLRLGISMMRRAWLVSAHSAVPSTPGMVKCFRLGLTTALMNPLTLAFFFGQATSSTLSREASAPLIASLMILVIAFTWFGAVAFAFSTAGFQRLYHQARPWVDTLAGGFFLVLGATMLRQVIG